MLARKTPSQHLRPRKRGHHCFGHLSSHPDAHKLILWEVNTYAPLVSTAVSRYDWRDVGKGLPIPLLTPSQDALPSTRTLCYHASPRPRALVSAVAVR